MDILKLLPFALKLLHQSDRIKKLTDTSAPAFQELKKAWPEAAPLARDIIDRAKRLWTVLQPTVAELKKAWPTLQADGKVLLDQIWPELEAQWAREPMLPAFSVRWLQESLNKLERPSADHPRGAPHRLKVDGLMGEATAEAVKRYQKEKGLEVDGWAGPETCAAILADLTDRSDG